MEKAEISAIYEVGKILTSTQSFGRSLVTSLRTLQSILGFDRAAVLLPDASTREIVMEASSGYTAEQRDRARYVWGEGIVGKTMKTGSPIAIPDVRKEPFFLDKTRAHGKMPDGPVSYLSVPIKVGAEVLGVLTAERIGREGTRPLEADTRTLTVVGCLLGQALKLHAAIERLQKEFRKQRREFEKTIRRTYRIGNIIGQIKRMQEVFAAVASVAPSRATVLLRGESGTGKEMIARSLHLLSPRAGRAFVTVNCAALPETLLESELFGHKRGAFTGAIAERKGRFEEAGGGTLFLDEIGDIPPPTQVKLLRVLQERRFARHGENRSVSVDVRIIAATNADLETMVEAGRFREDLFYRLNVIPIFLPPLRDRREDIVPLTEHFLDGFNRENGRNVSFAPDALEALLDYRWPGNVRELENLIERVVVMAKEPIVRIHDLPRALRVSRTHPPAGPPAAVRGAQRKAGDFPFPEGGPPAGFPEGMAGRADRYGPPAPSADLPRAAYLKELEKEELRRALESTGWVIARARPDPRLNAAPGRLQDEEVRPRLAVENSRTYLAGDVPALMGEEGEERPPSLFQAPASATAASRRQFASVAPGDPPRARGPGSRHSRRRRGVERSKAQPCGCVARRAMSGTPLQGGGAGNRRHWTGSRDTGRREGKQLGSARYETVTTRHRT
jgi:Nif-specific regulatory protein